MTGANEAELMNELRTPFAMFGLIDNMANGLGEKLTVRWAVLLLRLTILVLSLSYLTCDGDSLSFRASAQLEDFKLTQKLNAERMERAICLVLDELAEKKFLSTFGSPASA